MWPFRRMPLCVLQRGLEPLTHSDVYFGALEALRDAGHDEEAEELRQRYDDLFGQGLENEDDFDFAREAKKLIERYVRVKVVA